MKNIERAWKKLSLTGRFCYLFMCVETYLVTRFPERDWTPVAKRCWQWTEDYWDKGWDIYCGSSRADFVFGRIAQAIRPTF